MQTVPSTIQEKWATPEHRVSSNSDEVLFASSLDNARRCFLVLKYVFMPLAVLYGVIMAALNALWLFGYLDNFSNVFSGTTVLALSSSALPSF